jgi:hypothetical protein
VHDLRTTRFSCLLSNWKIGTDDYSHWSVFTNGKRLRNSSSYSFLPWHGLWLHFLKVLSAGLGTVLSPFFWHTLMVQSFWEERWYIPVQDDVFEHAALQSSTFGIILWNTCSVPGLKIVKKLWMTRPPRQIKSSVNINLSFQDSSFVCSIL